MALLLLVLIASAGASAFELIGAIAVRLSLPHSVVIGARTTLLLNVGYVALPLIRRRPNRYLSNRSPWRWLLFSLLAGLISGVLYHFVRGILPEM